MPCIGNHTPSMGTLRARQRVRRTAPRRPCAQPLTRPPVHEQVEDWPQDSRVRHVHHVQEAGVAVQGEGLGGHHPQRGVQRRHVHSQTRQARLACGVGCARRTAW